MDNKKTRKIKRKNAKLYPIYKMFAWDLLFYYSIEFLFLTMTKKIDASTILIVNGMYLIFKVIMQMPATCIIENIGKRKSIIIGNLFIALYLIVLIFTSSVIGVAIAFCISACGYTIKTLAESNLLYDSVSTRGGEGLYSSLDTKGSSLYYIFEAIASMISGYLFVINNYLPIIISLICVTIATIISFMFKDVYEVENTEKKNTKLKDLVDQHVIEFKICFKFILKSNRIKSLIIFSIIFYSTTKIISTYRSDLLVSMGVPEQQFAMIFAILSLIGGISVPLKKKIEKKFKNRTITFLALSYAGAGIVVGFMAYNFKQYINIAIPIILVMYIIQKISSSIWWILESKYIKNFTNEKSRNQLTFAFEFLSSIAACISSVLAGLLLKITNIETAFLIISLISLVGIVNALEYMRTRIGLKPEEYSKEDLEFKK